MFRNCDLHSARTWSAEGNTSDTIGQYPQQQLSSSAFFRVPFSAHYSSSCIQRMFSLLLRSWVSSSTFMQMTYNSMITVLPVIQPSSPSVSLTASRSWANGCPATASNWMLRKRSSSGWARLAAWLDAPSTRSSSVAFQFNHLPQFAISVLSLHWFWHELHGSCHQADADVLLPHSSAPVYPSVAHCEFFARPGPSADSDATGLLQRTPRWGTKVSPQPVVSRPARLILLLPRSSSVENEIRTLLQPALAGYSCEGNFQAVLARFMGRLHPTWSGTSHRSALSSDAHIPVRPPRARCLRLDRGRRQLDLGRSPSPLRLHGTVSRLIFVIPGWGFWLLDVDSKLICLILLVIYLLSCPFDSYFCIVLVCELLAAFVTI